MERARKPIKNRRYKDFYVGEETSCIDEDVSDSDGEWILFISCHC